MRFRKKENTQDVIVSCCILHNIRKEFKKENKRYTELEYRQQRQISEYIQHYAHAQQFRLQNYLIDHYFH